MQELVVIDKQKLYEFLMAIAEDLYLAQARERDEVTPDILEQLSDAINNTIIDLTYKDE